MARCLFCAKHAAQPTCSQCCGRFEHFRWYGCARCGSASCTQCNELPDFLNVSSLFTLNPITASLLSAAKDKNDPWAQNIFEFFLLPYFHRYIRTFAASHRVEYIVLAPLRVERLWVGLWHPLASLKNQFLADECLLPKVILPFTKGRQKQSLVPARHRGWEDGAFLLGLEHLRQNQPNSVLFVDDVLTTASTAHFVRRQFSKYNDAKDVSQWSVVSLFRTPRSPSMS